MKIKLRIASALYILFAFIYIGGHIWNIPTLLANFLIAVSGLCSLVYCVSRFGFRGRNSVIIAFGMLFTVLMVFSMLYNGNADILDVLWIWTYMGIAALMYEFEIPGKVYWGCVYVFVGYIFLHILRGESPKEFLHMGSENNISAYLIFFMLAGYLSRMREKKAINYIPLFLCLAVCLWSGSRAGVLSAAVLLACVFLYNYFGIKKGKAGTVLKVSALLLAGGWAINNFFGDYITRFTSKMEYYGGESVRTELWAEYLQGLFRDPGNFLFGVNTTGVNYPLLGSYGGNPHNSFFTLHSKFGIITFVLVMILLVKVLSKAVREKNPIMVIVLVSASLRMMFDWIAFPGLYDVLFWYMLLYFAEPAARGSRTKKQAAGNKTRLVPAKPAAASVETEETE